MQKLVDAISVSKQGMFINIAMENTLFRWYFLEKHGFSNIFYGYVSLLEGNMLDQWRLCQSSQPVEDVHQSLFTQAPGPTQIEKQLPCWELTVRPWT